MILKFIYLAAFLAGLALAVSSMLHGVERWRRSRTGTPSVVLNPPTVASLLAGFGACGYLLTVRTTVSPRAILLVALATGAAALTGMIVLMAKWALRTPEHPMPHEEDEINGQVATVSREIASDEAGEITYFAWDAMHVLPALSLDGSAIPEGTEVVIDVMEDGIARVELWSVVEQRL